MSNRKFTSCYNRLWGKMYGLITELCMKRDTFVCLKGEITPAKSIMSELKLENVQMVY